MANKKIAFIITKLELGGAQKSVLYSVRNLNRPPIKTYLLCGKGGYLDKEAKKNVKGLFFIPDLVREISPLKDLKAFLQIRKRLKNIKPDIVHTNSSKAGILGRLAAASIIKGPKIVHTVHGFSFYEGQKPLKKYFYVTAEKLLAKVTDKLIFVSREDMDTALKLKITKAAQCTLIRAGVEVRTKQDFKDFDKAAKLRKLGLKENAKIILCTANLKPQKNPLDMIKAAEIVCKKEPSCVYLYTGTGPLKQAAQKLISRRKLKNNFKLLGHRKDISELLAVADVFSLSSLWEGLPMALVEALFMSVPGVCYDSGGIREVLKSGKNGFLTPRGNYKKMAENQLKALNKKDFAFRPEDLEDFDIKNMIKKQRELYLSFGGGK